MIDKCRNRSVLLTPDSSTAIRIRNNMNKLFGILFICLLTLPASAQLVKKGDADFSEALTAYKQKKFEQAMKLFEPITKDYSNEDRSAYAKYYYASAAQQLDKDQEGWNMLQQLL